MRDKDIVARIGSTIAPTAVRDYAKSRGWQAIEGSRRRVWIFRHREAGLRQLIIPIDRDPDWSDALFEVVLRLSEQEQLDTETVLNNLLSVHSDVLRFRIGGDDVAGGMLPMGGAVGLIDGARRALLASACSVISKVTHHPRMSRSEADEFVQGCKMGQTEIGSYVVKVVCPLTTMEEPSPSDETQPFARATTLLLLLGCQKIVQGIEEDCVDGMIEENERRPRITSNLCDALLRMHAAREDTDLTIDISWAALPKLPIPPIPPRVSFKPEYFRVVEQIRQELIPQRDVRERGFLFGTVETLNGDIGNNGRRSGEVTFALLLPDEEVVRARGNLSADDYEIAVAAHERGRGYISFNAVLKRGVKIGRVEGITGFRELTDSDVSDASSR